MTEPAESKRVTGNYRAWLLGGIAVGIVVLGGLVILRPQSTCEGIIEQTAPHLEANLEIIRSKGALAVGQEKIQELTESAQKVGLHLKTCCSVLQGGKLNPAQFQQCVDGATGYERQVARVAEQVNESSKTQAADAPQQRVAIAQAITEATQGAENLGRQVAQLQPVATPKPDAPQQAGHESEVNDSPTSANTIDLNNPVEGEIKTGGDLDYFKVTASKPVRDLVRVSLENLSTTLMPQLLLYNQNKSQIGGDHYDATPGANLDVTFTLEAGTDSYVRVANSSGNPGGAYRLRLTYQDAADAQEPNETAAQATVLSAGQSMPGSILDKQDQDWYRFQARSAAVRVRMDNDSSTLAPQLYIFDENRSQLANPYNGTNGASVEYSLAATPGKTYYIEVAPYGDTSVPGKYRISIADQKSE